MTYRLPMFDTLPQVVTGGPTYREKAQWQWSPKNQLVEMSTRKYWISYSLSDGVAEVRTKNYHMFIEHDNLPNEIDEIIIEVVLNAKNVAYEIHQVAQNGHWV